MRLDLETTLLLAAAILLYPFIYIYFPELRDGATFYLILSIGSTLVIFLLTRQYPVDLDNRRLLETASIVFLNMMLNAIVFAALAESLGVFSIIPSLILLYTTGIPLVYSLYVGLGETFLYVGLPLALSEKLPGPLKYLPAIAINALFALYFALLHAKAYNYHWIVLLQPFIAGLINAVIAIKNRNLAGVVLGHWLTDFVIFSSGVLV